MKSPVERGIGNRRVVAGAARPRRRPEPGFVHLGPSDLQAIFRDSPVSIWVEDFSGVKARLDELRDKGVRDVRRHFAKHPEEIIALARAVKILAVNDATLRLYEARSQGMLRRGLSLVFDKESYNVFREEVIALAEGRTQFSGEVVTRSLKGHLRHVWLWLVVPPGSAATLSRAFVFVTDITALKESQKDLAAAEVKFRTIFECAPDALLMIDGGTGIVVEGNRRAEALFGRSMDQITGMHVSELVPGLGWADHLKSIQDREASGGWAAREAVVRRGDGGRVPVSARSCFASIEEDLRVLMMLREARETASALGSGDGRERAGGARRFSAGDLEKLSRREREVVRLVAAGFTNRQIAKRLFLSVKTIETHRARLMDKLGCHKTADVVRFAIYTGLCGETPEKV